MPGYEPFLLCDFHVHTQWSDGKLTVGEVVDLYGSTGKFDAIAITDHILMKNDMLARAGRLAFKPVSSAKWTDVTVTRRGGVLVQIEHDDLKGVTPDMLKWWFENMAGTTTWNGSDFSGPEIFLYHLWHHRDHIRITPVTDAPDGSKNRGFARARAR